MPSLGRARTHCGQRHGRDNMPTSDKAQLHNSHYLTARWQVQSHSPMQRAVTRLGGALPVGCASPPVLTHNLVLLVSLMSLFPPHENALVVLSTKAYNDP